MALTFRDNNLAPLSYDEMDSNWRFFTGSFINTGTITAEGFTSNGNISASADVYGVTGSFLHLLGDGSQITGVTGEWDGSHLGDASITGSLTIEDSTTFFTPLLKITNTSTGRLSQFGTTADPDKIVFTNGGNITTVGNIEADGNISASADVYGVTGSFSHLLGSSPLTIESDNLNVDSSGNITSSANISSSGTIYGNSYQMKNQPLATYVGNVLRLTDSAWDYIDINNTTVTIGGGTGDLQLQNITASGDISASGDLYGVGLTTSGSRVKHFTEITTIAPISSPVEELSSTDELVFITNNNSSAAGTGEGNLDITNWYSFTDPGTTVECVVVGGTGIERVLLRYETMGDPININGTSTGVNGVYQITNSQGATAVGSSFKITNLGNLSASLWGTGIYP